MNRVARIVNPHENEPIGSYCSRLAAAYGLRSAAKFAELFEFSFRGLLSGSPRDMAAFAEVAGLPVRTFEHSTIVQVGRDAYVNGHFFKRRFIEQYRCKLCPCCVIGSLGPLKNVVRSFGQTEWVVKSLRCCPVHDCELLTLPGKSWSQAADFASLVQANFAIVEQAAKVPSLYQASSFERFTVSRVTRGSFEPTWLDTLPLQTAIHFSETLGAVVRHGTEPDLETLTTAEMVYAGRDGITITMEGPEAIRSTLRDIARRETSPRRPTLTSLFGRLASEMLEFSDGDGYKEIVALMEAVAEEV